MQVKKVRLAQIMTMLSVVLLWMAFSCSAEEQQNYFYQNEPLHETARKSCSDVFEELVVGSAEDVGEIVRNLKSINVHYLLEDYDNSLSSDIRKRNYLTLDGLAREVEENKRGVYCRIELAIYMRQDASFRSPVYDMLLDEAFMKIDQTYASAMASLKKEHYARALYAFDLIAPYSDSHKMYMQVAQTLEALSVENVVEIAKADAEFATDGPEAATEVGPVTMAVSGNMNKAVPSKDMSSAIELGPIALAAKLGPIMMALNSIEREGSPTNIAPQGEGESDM